MSVPGEYVIDDADAARWAKRLGVPVAFLTDPDFTFPPYDVERVPERHAALETPNHLRRNTSAPIIPPT